MTSKEVDGFPNYLIFEDARVFSKKRNRFLKPYNDAYGYRRVNLCKDGIRKQYFLHRLVALHFILNPDNKREVDHIDRNPQNNNISNLRWATGSENCANTSKRCDNTSGHKNIYYLKRKNTYQYIKKIQGKVYCKTSKNKIDCLCYKYIMLLRQKAGQL